MMMWQGIDQRRFPRVNYKCLIRMSRGGHEEVIETFTENIGAGGICVSIDVGFELFDTVVLEVYLTEGEEPIHCKGSIVWVVMRRPVVKTEKAKYDTGIEFIDIPENDRERVSMLVDEIIKAEA
ncbi:MAG: PilZ domain-containing protein [Candidatus Omnitrophota bacterium]